MPAQAKLDLHLHHETGGAFLVSNTGKERDAVWLPKPLVDSDYEIDPKKKTIELTVPEWLAQREGLI